MISDKVAMKLLDKKEFVLKLKQRKRIFSKETVDTKSFKLNELATKCTMEKDIALA